MQQQDRPIGVFDSGLGGLSVLNAAMAQLPNESFIYVADSKYAPYGEKTDDWMLQRASELCQFLVKKQVKLILIACNTATLATVNHLRIRFSVPIVAIEPGIKPAVAIGDHVLMLATRSTIDSLGYQKLLPISRCCTSGESSCIGWVELVEKHDYHQPYGRALIAEYLQVVKEKPINVLVLGCTHFLFKTEIDRYLIKQLGMQQAAKIAIIDTSEAVAKQLTRVLAQHQLQQNKQNTKQLQFFTSADAVELSQVQKLCSKVSEVIKLS